VFLGVLPGRFKRSGKFWLVVVYVV